MSQHCRSVRFRDVEALPVVFGVEAAPVFGRRDLDGLDQVLAAGVDVRRLPSRRFCCVCSSPV